jgi:hypothetical protein
MRTPTSAPERLYAMQGLALARNLAVPDEIRGLRVFMPYIELMRQDGAVFILQMHPLAGNDEPKIGVSIFGKPLGPGGSIATSASTLEEAIILATLEYASRCWSFRW